MSSEDPMASPRKRGLIHFNPKFARQNTNGSAPPSSQDQSSSESTASSTFPKPRKYFDSADFFMREEMKNHDNFGEKSSHKKKNGEKTHHGSALASECQTVNRPGSPDSVNKNVVPLILLRRSKSSAMINSADGMDEAPESLPTTVEALNGPSNREIPQGSSSEGSPSDSRGESPSLESSKPQSPRTREEVRSLLIPRLNKMPAHDESSLAVSSSSPRNRSSPLRLDDEAGEKPSDD